MEHIAYCGLYCGNCPNHTGLIANLARDLRRELRHYRFEKTAELLSAYPFFRTFETYGDCYQVLGAMVKMRCGKTCRNDGANPGCKIRKCAQKKELAGCWECGDFERCEKLAKSGPEAFEKGEKYWYVK